MGLLDDAIREHLELKRTRGADPDELARAEHEALEPVVGEEHSDGAAEDDSGIAPAQPPAAGAIGDDLQARQAIGDISSVGQETAEIDMSAVLAEDDAPDVAAGIDEIPGQERLTFE
jgi:hypothetical protein